MRILGRQTARSLTAVAAALATLLLAGCFMPPWSNRTWARHDWAESADTDQPVELAAHVSTEQALDSGLVIEDLAEGDGAACQPDSLVTITWTADLDDGKRIASTPRGSLDGPWPLDRLISGMSAGIVGMKEGGRRRLTIPPTLGYAGFALRDPAASSVLAPPNATLIVDVTLVKVESPSPSSE